MVPRLQNRTIDNSLEFTFTFEGLIEAKVQFRPPLNPGRWALLELWKARRKTMHPFGLVKSVARSAEKRPCSHFVTQSVRAQTDRVRSSGSTSGVVSTVLTEITRERKQPTQ